MDIIASCLVPAAGVRVLIPDVGEGRVIWEWVSFNRRQWRILPRMGYRESRRDSMASFDKQEAKEILDLLEEELNLIQKLDKIEKMKIRSSIRKQANWLMGVQNPTTERVYRILEDRLPDAFSVYPYEFSNKLRDLLDIKLIGLRKREKQRLRERARELAS